MLHFGGRLPHLSFRVLLKKKKHPSTLATVSTCQFHHCQRAKPSPGVSSCSACRKRELSICQSFPYHPNYCQPPLQIPTQPLEICFAGSRDISSGPLSSLLPHWLAPEEEPWDLQLLTETSTSGTDLVILASNPFPLLPPTLLLQHRSTEVIW